MDEWLTYEEAAALLGCVTSRVAKLVDRGELRTRIQLTGHRSRRGTFRRADVERVAAADRQRDNDRAARQAANARAAVLKAPPNDDHEWVSIPEAAKQLGLTDKAVLARIHRERLPATRVGRRWWIRQDQLTIIEAGRLGTLTKRV